VAALEQALAKARSATIDAAILDVNLNGQDTFEVAEILRERRIPFVFATGYGATALARRFENAHLVQTISQERSPARGIPSARPASGAFMKADRHPAGHRHPRPARGSENGPSLPMK
jgi:CheY-like chemotaxis protein